MKVARAFKPGDLIKVFGCNGSAKRDISPASNPLRAANVLVHFKDGGTVYEAYVPRDEVTWLGPAKSKEK